MNPVLLAIPVVAVIGAVAIWVVSSSRHYGALFADEHFREFHGALAERVRALPREAQFVTSRDLAVVITCTPEGEKTSVHISLSQRGRPTTRAVGSRFGFWVLSMLEENVADLDPFVTPSGVHHMAFSFQRRPIVTASFEKCLASYQREYQDIPFRPVSPPES